MKSLLLVLFTVFMVVVTRSPPRPPPGPKGGCQCPKLGGSRFYTMSNCNIFFHFKDFTKPRVLLMNKELEIRKLPNGATVTQTNIKHSQMFYGIPSISCDNVSKTWKVHQESPLKTFEVTHAYCSDCFYRGNCRIEFDCNVDKQKRILLMNKKYIIRKTLDGGTFPEETVQHSERFATIPTVTCDNSTKSWKVKKESPFDEFAVTDVDCYHAEIFILD